MKVLLDEAGYVQSFALVGDLTDGMEVPDPEDAEHFAEHFRAYNIRDETAVFDPEHNEALQLEAAMDEYRIRREKECFSVVDRSWLWYENLTSEQKEELRIWYQGWLDGTPTQTVPEKPAWLTK